MSKKNQFLSTYAQKLELLEKDKENKRAANIVAAEEIGRGISRGSKRMAGQPANREQVHEKALKTSSPLSTHASSSTSSSQSTASLSSLHYSSIVPFSP